MCGIAGILRSYDPNHRDSVVSEMLCLMRYRGPDASGMYSNPMVTLGNVRLAIQGIDPTGNQPIYNEDRSIVTVFNGEIYNHQELRIELLKRGHKFSSNTDTELLVHLYEDFAESFVEKLNGMFAFAIFDNNKQLLLLARDRIGQKPLFVYESNDVLAFCSELKALLPAVEDPKVNEESVSEYLSLGYILEPQTILKNVRVLMPGTVEIFRKSGIEKKQYWSPVCSPKPFEDVDHWLEAAKPMFYAATKRHLLSDVPVSLFLSGGVDSSLILALTANESTIKEVFTGSFLDEDDHDEFVYASALSRAFGKKCNRVDLSKKHLENALPLYLKSLPQPSGDYSGLASFVLCREISQSYRVVLGGDGGDELFGGYPTYKLPHIQKKYWFIPKQAISIGAFFARSFFSKDTYLSIPFQLQQLQQSWGKDNAEAHYFLKSFFPSIAQHLLIEPLRICPDRSIQEFKRIYSQSNFQNPSDRLATVDMLTFLLSGTIPKIERMSMQSSVEVRLPFLDNDILDLSASTPWSLRYKDGKQKHVLRKLFHLLCQERDMELPRAINPRKQGFSPPLRKLLSTNLKSWRNETLFEGCNLFSTNLLDEMNRIQRLGFDTHRLEWNICTLCSWIRDNQIAI
jgi:asparagine synthase (glutamine-hydrolysing)